MSGRRLLTTHTALLSLWFASIAPFAYGGADPASSLPVETIAYVGWDGLLDESSRGWLQAIPALVSRFGDKESGEKLAAAMEMIEIAGRGSGGIALVGTPGVASEGPPIAIVLDAGERTTEFFSGIRRLAQAQGNTPVIETEFSGVRFAHFDAPSSPFWGTCKGRIIIARSQAAASAVVATLNGGASLASQDAYRGFRRSAGFGQTPPWMLSGHVACEPLLDAIKNRPDGLPPKAQRALDALGITSVRGGCFQVTESEAGMVTRVFVATNEKKGILKLWESAPITDETLGMIPQDAFWAVACSVDLMAIWEEARLVIEAFEPDAMQKTDGGLAMASGVLGFSLTDDLLPALGDTWILYDAPDHGGLLISGAALIFETRDAQALRDIFARVMQIVGPLAAQNEVNLDARRISHNGHTIDYLIASGLPVPVAPSVCYVDKYAICALTPQTIRVVLDQLDSPKSKGTILDHPDVASVRSQLGEPIQSFYYMDTDYALRTSFGLGNLVRTAYASTASANAPEIDPGLLPTLPETLAANRDAVGSCQATSEGILYTAYGAPMIATPGSVAIIALLVSILLPSLSRARELAKRAVSGSNLRMIGMGCHIYANQHDDQFPEFLDQLVVEGHCTPQHLISPRGRRTTLPETEFAKVVQSGRFTRDTVQPGTLPNSYVYIAGQSLESHGRNVIMYEEVVDDEGTNVLFVDGHVEFMKFPFFQQTLRATYHRLGRDDEIPAEFRE
jgi:prepilin-type processing-associated H-X9-DG protein